MIIKTNNSKLHLVHFHNQSEMNQKVEAQYSNLKLKLKDIDFTTHWISSDDSIEKNLKQFCDMQSIHLLTLLYHKYSFLQSLVKTSTVEKVSFHTNVPVLILPDSI